MAGDWIKMRNNLHTHPKVVRIASALKADRLKTVGGLHAVWCLFDEHSEDGSLSGYSLHAIDELIGFEGFASAMVSVKWLVEGVDCVVLPEFDEHNGQSAKRRAQETQRKRREREETAANAVQKTSARDADKKRTREEKRREDIDTPQPPEGFEAFWKAYPNHKARANAEKAWKKVPANLHSAVMAAVALQTQSLDWTKDNGQYIPHAASWLNGKRWEDQLPAAAAKEQESFV